MTIARVTGCSPTETRSAVPSESIAVGLGFALVAIGDEDGDGVTLRVVADGDGSGCSLEGSAVGPTVENSISTTAPVAKSNRKSV